MKNTKRLTLVITALFIFSAGLLSQVVDSACEVAVWKNFTKTVTVYTFDNNTPNL